MKLSQLKIDPEFQSKIPPLQFEEEQQLEQNIIAEGRLLNPIITWNGYILDGHTRYRILKKHGFIKFEVEEIQLANKYEALAWICKNQLGRRNLSPERKKFLLGKEYESTKLAVGGQPGNCNKVNGCERYVEMLRIINEAWKGNVDSYLAGVIRGVARFISVYEGEYSRERLVQQLARTHPKTITQLAQKDTGSSANRHMRQILRIYNGASREMSLPLKN
ncbi:DUF6551 family protein [Faecalibacterium prausnitzii]|uniref:DUF6551 family protein n=1 Tax=Faecalibacterium prausnitzii TaxID=853 RepID=UPI001FA886B5|nr:DUF6551 family protein [Faecalibacterium prausnitzii]